MQGTTNARQCLQPTRSSVRSCRIAKVEAILSSSRPLSGETYNAVVHGVVYASSSFHSPAISLCISNDCPDPLPWRAKPGFRPGRNPSQQEVMHHQQTTQDMLVSIGRGTRGGVMCKAAPRSHLVFGSSQTNISQPQQPPTPNQVTTTL